MALVAIVALGLVIPRWWVWHHRMLERSDALLELARAEEFFAESTTQAARNLEGRVKHPEAEKQFRRSQQELAQIAENARADRRAAVFPWLRPSRPAPSPSQTRAIRK